MNHEPPATAEFDDVVVALEPFMIEPLAELAAEWADAPKIIRRKEVEAYSNFGQKWKTASLYAFHGRLCMVEFTEGESEPEIYNAVSLKKLTEVKAWGPGQTPLESWEDGNNLAIIKTAGGYVISFQCAYINICVTEGRPQKILLKCMEEMCAASAIVSQKPSQ